MAGFIAIDAESMDIGQIEDLLKQVRKMGVTRRTPVHFGTFGDRVILAIPAEVSKKNLPPVTKPTKTPPMKHARRSRQ